MCTSNTIIGIISFVVVPSCGVMSRGVNLLAAPVVCMCVIPRHICLPLPCHWLVANSLHVLLGCTFLPRHVALFLQANAHG